MSQIIEKLFGDEPAKSNRDAITYIRLTTENKKFIDSIAKKFNITCALVINKIVDEFRTKAD